MNKHKKNKCNCGNEKNYETKCCRNCANKQHSLRMKGSGNPFYNKHHTKKSRMKISQTHKGKKKKPFTKIHRANLSKTKIGTNNPMYGLKGKLSPSYGMKRKQKTRILLSLLRGGTGIPYENREYSEKFYNIREKIRKRDNYICQSCKIPEIECRRELDIHHIDYNKDNCEEGNLIALCCSCNTKANFNRTYWQNLYSQKVLKIREII